MAENKKKLLIGILVFLVVIMALGTVMIKRLTPSKEIMSLDEYFDVKNNEVVVLMHNNIYEKRGIVIEGQVYLDYDTIVENFNHRFYWDSKENLLIYTTPTEVVKTDAGTSDYYINRSKNTEKYTIVKLDGNQVYIAMDYVKKFSNIEYEIYDSPKRIVIDYKWGENFLYTEVKKGTNIRFEPSIKSPILTAASKGDILNVIVDEEEVNKKFTKVRTKDGIIGYIQNKCIKESYYETPENDYKAPEYTNISKDYEINMVWHQVTNQDANENLLNMLETTKSVNTISPTWFSVISNEGEISSLASEKYVERAHNNGIEVWALVDDFNQEINMMSILSNTSTREKLENELLSAALKYGLDGINIDFERITKEMAVHYIQFIRELSIKCRNNSIVLSIDNYVPMPYSAYYDREEQGKIADYVITMAYDEHYASSDVSGSVASYNFVKEGIENTLKEVPKEKVIIGIPFYTRLWKETKEGDQIKVSSESYSMGNSIKYFENRDITPEWDDETKQYYGEYQEDDVTYKMWLEEEKSLEEKLKLIDSYGVAGISAWKLGLEKENIWNVIIKYIN